jgi:hypothetical protein
VVVVLVVVVSGGTVPAVAGTAGHSAAMLTHSASARPTFVRTGGMLLVAPRHVDVGS